MDSLRTNLKRWMMLIEMKRFTLPVHGGVDVWQDAPFTVLQRLIHEHEELRGVAEDNTYWVWNGRAADHYHVEPHLGLDDATGFVITRKGYVPDWGHWSKQIPRHASAMTLWFEGSDDDLPQGLARIFQSSLPKQELP